MLSYLSNKISKLITPKATSGTSFSNSRDIFLYAVSLVYLIAFLSLLPQIEGLLGPEGLFPVVDMLSDLSLKLPLYQRLWLVPSVFWISASSLALYIVSFLGILFSLSSLHKKLRQISLVSCWLLYLSIVASGGPFFQFQWDNLLLEAGLLSIFLAHPHNSSKLRLQSGALFLLHWLLFRLMFSSGIAKLVSGDPNWSSLTALQYHFETQPLPTPLAFYVHRLPELALQFSCLATLFIELVLPFFIFGSARMRRVVAIVFIIFQMLIASTGNYGFFNLLTIALCLLLLDDKFLRKIKKTQQQRLTPGMGSASTVFIFLLSLTPLLQVTIPSAKPPQLVAKILEWTQPFHLVHGYGLFSVMTTERLVVVLEESADGELWTELVYPWQPQIVTEAPKFIAPYHPRLDWQIWFATFSQPQRLPWFTQLVGGLLADSKPIRSLLRKTEFNFPPKQMRVLIYRYEFTNRHNRKVSGVSWKRTLLGIYLHQVRRKTAAE